MATERHPSANGQARSRTHLGSTVFATLPSAIIAISEFVALVYAALGGARDTVELGIWGIYAGIAAALLLLVVVPFLRLPNRLVVGITMISATTLAAILGFATWVGATSIACHGATDCPFG